MNWAITAAIIAALYMGYKMHTPRGIRNNNPGNIEYNPANEWRGQIGHDGRFVIFDSMENGVRALSILITNYYQRHGLTTIRQIINRYAPPVENVTSSYVDHVADQAGIDPDVPMTAIGPYLSDIVATIIKHENGREIEPIQLAQGVSMGMQTKGLA